MKIEKENGQKREKGCFSFTIFSIALICVALLLSNISTNLRENVNKISYSDFLEAIDKGTLKEVKIVDITDGDGVSFKKEENKKNAKNKDVERSFWGRIKGIMGR